MTPEAHDTNEEIAAQANNREPDVANEPNRSAILQKRIDAIRSSLRRLKGEHAVHGLTTANRLEELEHQLYDLTGAVGEMEPDAISEQSRGLFADARDWAELNHTLNLDDAAVKSEQMTDLFAEDKIRRWQEKVDSLETEEAPEVFFVALLQTTELTLDVLGHNEVYERTAPILADVRSTLRRKFKECLEKSEDADPLRDRWASALVDRGSMTVADLPSIGPQQAAEKLNCVAIDTEWHLEEIEDEGGPRARKIRRTVRKMRNEWQERVLQARLENKFGGRAVAMFERLIFGLILAVIALLLVEAFVDLSDTALEWLMWADTAICVVFLWEFFTKIYYAPLRTRWFFRHFLIDFLPAIPFGIIIGVGGADNVRGLRIFRFIRLTRFGRYLRIARPLIRFLRVFGFFLRGMNRLARFYQPLINWNIILYPTKLERERGYQRAFSYTRQLRRLRAHLNERWKHLLVSSDEATRASIALARLRPLKSAHDRGLINFDLAETSEAAQDVPADILFTRMSRITPEEIQIELGDDLTMRLARMVRLLSWAPFRWLPIIRSIIPRLGTRMSDPEVVAAATRKLAVLLLGYYDRWFWIADLHGTITPSQFVDRVGAMLVRSAIRPAYRLTMFGAFFLLTRLLLQLTGSDFLRPISIFLGRFLGLPIIILGLICLFVVAVGFWLQRLAREATEFFEHAASAQFLALTENIRARELTNDAEVFYERIIKPERRLLPAEKRPSAEEDIRTFIDMMKEFLVGSYVAGDASAAFDATERTVLLYRDSLDGAILADSDTRTTSQLLGNPVLRRVRYYSSRITKRDEKQIRALDLERQKSLFGGPYLWFNLITRAVAHHVAHLIIDYNRHAVPLSELETARAEEKRMHQVWLADPETVDPRDQKHIDDDTFVVTTAFTALHFLDDDPDRDREVAERFGPEVLERLKRDRSQLFRRVFGCFPLHRQPKERRVFNLYSLYRNWFGSGRILFLPIFFIWRGFAYIGKLLTWIVRCVQEIRRPNRKPEYVDATEADFVSAVRKIDRMRAPVVHACIRLRAKIDPEYLGIPLPAMAEYSLEGMDLETDAQFVDLDPNFREELDLLQRRSEADMQRLGRLIDEGLLQRMARHLAFDENAMSSHEHIRAAAAAYLGNYLHVREHLSALEILDEVYQSAASKNLLSLNWLPNIVLWWRFRRYWRRHGFGDKRTKKAAWRATSHNVWGAADAIRVWAKEGDAATEKGERILAEFLRHPSRISEALVTLRAVQTLAMLDILKYRRHVFRLGGYSDESGRLQSLLEWGITNEVE